MGLFDRLKKMMTGDPAAEEPVEAAAPRARKRGERPPLSAPAAPTATIEDALEARAEGNKARAREILQAIDRGAGLRTVLRATAALEANDIAELETLLPKLRSTDAPWRLALQTAAALADAHAGEGASVTRAERLVDQATHQGAPSYAVAWARCAIGGEDDRRRALVDLLFADAPLARTVAARDLKIEGAHEDTTAIARFASLDAGRTAIKRFGPKLVADVLDRSAMTRGA